MKIQNLFKTLLIIFVMMLICNACSTIPDGAKAVKPFKVEKYLGKWYEIARLDFKYERGLNNTTAEYSFR